MKMTSNSKEVTSIVDGISGRAAIWHTGNCIAASMDHIALLPPGATQDEHNPSYHSIRNPSARQMAEFLRNLANAEARQ